MNPRSVLCEDGNPCPDFLACHQNCECIRGLGRNVLLKDMTTSQPNPTPQEPTAPTLEQLAEAQSKAYNAYIKANAEYCKAVNAYFRPR